MTDRVPTEAEWGLVGQLIMSDIHCEPQQYWMKWWFRSIGDGKGRILFYETELHHGKPFRPLEDSNDTNRLVQAMCKAGYVIKKTHSKDGTTTVSVLRHIGLSPILRALSGIGGTTDRYATTFACIGALAAEAERKRENRK